MTDLVTEARAALLQQVLRYCATHLPPKALAELRDDITAMRERAAQRVPPNAGMAEACDMALADLLIDVMRDRPPRGRQH